MPKGYMFINGKIAMIGEIKKKYKERRKMLEQRAAEKGEVLNPDGELITDYDETADVPIDLPPLTPQEKALSEAKVSIPPPIFNQKPSYYATMRQSGLRLPEVYKKLALKKVDEEPPITDIVAWVAKNACRDPDEIHISEVPSPIAVTLLYWVQISPMNLADFIKGPFSKLMPTSAPTKAKTKFSDDGRSTFELLDALMGEINEQEKQEAE